MRQVVAFSAAIDERRARERFEYISIQAQVHGAKMTASFDELFPEYSELKVEENVHVNAEAAKLMDKLAEQNLRELEGGK